MKRLRRFLFLLLSLVLLPWFSFGQATDQDMSSSYQTLEQMLQEALSLAQDSETRSEASQKIIDSLLKIIEEQGNLLLKQETDSKESSLIVEDLQSYSVKQSILLEIKEKTIKELETLSLVLGISAASGITAFLISLLVK